MNQLKKMDLFFFTILSIIAEITSSLSFKYFHSGFIFSFAIMIFIIFSIRWGKIAIISFVLSGIPLIFINYIGYLDGVIYYVLANFFAGIPILCYTNQNRRNILSSNVWLSLYVVFVFFSLSLGKQIALMILNHDWFGGIKYFISIIFTLIATLLFLFILKNIKHQKLLYDMEQYLNELEEEKKEVFLGNGKN